ncbi:MAG TPA: FliH/SctL family protein, partial [Polyangiaceae bacterium]|nr:FliH/SctL family protein [Polyangiaceae bacterium]
VEPREVLAASAKAEAIVARAEAEAARILADAEARAQALASELGARAKTEAASAVAARELVLAAREDAELERRLDQVVDLARLLAERLLGEALALDPTRVVALARQALTEARGARRLVLAAHPDDAPLLERSLTASSLAASVSVTVDPTRRRGSLRLETDVGTLDAELAPALDRLTEKLREALQRG